jgi:hypothetical protein
VKERHRAPLAAAVAFLIGGDLAARGPGALLDVWRYLFPYLWMFLAFEALRRKRRLLDEEAFLLGAAVGLLHDGALTKILQDGVLFLNVNWLSALTACFDWGLLTVVALHVADAALPRPAEESAAPPLRGPELAALVLLPGIALLLYLFDAVVGRARFERMLGPSWLLADLLFAGAAAALASRALSRAASDEPGPRGRGLWALAAFCAWLPGAQLAARAGGGGFFSWFYLVVWTGGLGFWARKLWLGRGVIGDAPRRDALPILVIAAWRLAGAALIGLTLGPLESDGRGAAAFAFLVDLPTRLIFLSVFFSARLAV